MCAVYRCYKAKSLQQTVVYWSVLSLFIKSLVLQDDIMVMMKSNAYPIKSNKKGSPPKKKRVENKRTDGDVTDSVTDERWEWRRMQYYIVCRSWCFA